MPLKTKKSNNPPEPEFMIRVQLPNPGDYSGGPSGDSEYEYDYHAAVAAKMPPGFELVKELLGTASPRDSHGYTYLRIRLTDRHCWEQSLQTRLKAAEGKLLSIEALLDE